MNPTPLVVLALVISMPCFWLASEFRERRWVRIGLGVASLTMSFGVAFLAGYLERFQSNSWFGTVTKELVDSTIRELEAGNEDRVLAALRGLREKYVPTYENRAGYDELAAEAVAAMGGNVMTPGDWQ
jgi:hypothetical protein